MREQRHWFIIVIFAILAGCESPEGPISPESPTTTPQIQDVNYKICSFNVQFLGSSKIRRNSDLTNYLASNGCQLVLLQELIAPPELTHQRHFPDGTPYRPNPKSTEFFNAMADAGFDGHWLSESDTGKSINNQSNGTNTEWHVAFYKTQYFSPALELPHGFIAKDVTNNENFDRVPFAFSFRDKSSQLDFVLINVHLRPGGGTADKTRRLEEVTGIAQWIESQESEEKDYIVVGDMNIENAKELATLEQASNMISLNSNAIFNTNTLLNRPKPYDHAFINPEFSQEIQPLDNFTVINLIEHMQDNWAEDSPFPGEPYVHNIFRMLFSDHHAVSFMVGTDKADDD